MDRYRVEKGSKSGHCCFDWTVVDTGKPEVYQGELMTDENGNPRFESVCECFEMAEAQLICDALNRPVA